MAACSVLWLFLIVSVFCSDAFELTKENPEIKLHHKMTKREIRHYFGVDSHDEVPDYEVTIPHQADPYTGEFLTYKLGNHARRRRSADPNVWFYNIQAFGINMRLNLSKARDVIGPKVQVETIHKNGSKSYSSQPKTSVLEGHVTSEPGSFAVINNNGGLSGIIRLMDQLLFVHPLPNHLAKDYGQQNGGGDPHVVYRHDDVKNTKRSCHTAEPKKHRSRRSVDENAPSSANKFMEIAIIADKFLLEDKKDFKDINGYLMMIAHLIERMYQDPSVGERKLHFEVVKLVLDRGNNLKLDRSDDILTRLGKLADWGKQNIEKTNGMRGHADVLVHLTAGLSGGLAKVSSTCKEQFGRAIGNDAGLATSIIAAHEIAHTMGVGHDGSGCSNGLNIMSTIVTSGGKAMTWSKCSKEMIQNFLSNEKRSSCLNNEPPKGAVFTAENSVSIPVEYHRKLPGQIYDGNAQCQLQYGQDWIQCPQRIICTSLLCAKGANRKTCSGRNTPPMDGTRCGDRHWCIKGECVDDGSPMIDGGWSNWSGFTTCTQTCGGGIRWRTRSCTKPKPQGGGEGCEGKSVGHYALCNKQDCPKGTKTFRDSQCEAKRPGSKAVYKEDPCVLACLKSALIWPHNLVADGTRCYADRRLKHVCVQGKCMHAGCDYVLNSGVKHDRCGVCGGDSSSCSETTGVFTEQYMGWGPGEGKEFVEIPAGSTNIKVEMKDLTRSLIGVKDISDRYIYNVGSTWSITVKAAGTKVAYDHEEYVYKDKLFIRGPTTKPLKIIYAGWMEKNPGVQYSFSSKKKSNVTADQVYWKTGNWSVCSTKCAGGIETRSVECLRKDDNSWVSDKVCAQRKPDAQRECNDQPCPPSWYQSSWRPCSKTCGRGKQFRKIVCRTKIRPGKYKTVTDEKCNANERPIGNVERDCNKISCHAEWVAGNWSKCSATCGPNGITTRQLQCKRLNQDGEYVSVDKRFCTHEPELPTTQSCNVDVPCVVPFKTPDGKEFIPVGCFKEGKFFHGERALPEMVANFRSKINWRNMTKTVLDCSQAVNKKNNTYKVFGIQFYGECWSGPGAEKTYAEYGWSKNCWNGVGGSSVNYIYTFV